MAKKYILSVCGTGGVTSSVITQKVNALAAEHGIEVDITNARAFSLQSKLEAKKYDLIITSTRLKAPDEDIPLINCMAYLTGVGEAAVSQKILEVLQKD